MDDIELVQQVKKNNKQAFRDLFNKHKDKVSRTAYLILKDNQLVEDIVQETFFRVYLKIHKLTNLAQFEGWLYKITINLCFEALRKQKKVCSSSLDEYIASGYEVSFGGLTPEDIAIAKDIKLRMLSSIYALPTKYTAVIILHYYNNFSIKEIAEIVKESEGNVKTRLFRARKLLEESLGKNQAVISDSEKGGALYGSR